MKAKILLASVLALAVASPALANMDKDDLKAKFQAADSNKDGTLNATEWKAAGWDSDKWSAVDSNKDGSVTWEEKVAYHDSKNATMKHN